MLTAKLILGAGAILAAPLFTGAILAGALGAAAPAPAGAGESAGGLTLTPHAAARGESVTLANTSADALHITLRARPWLQGRDGSLAPDPRRNLNGVVRTSASSFTLGPGERRAIRVDQVARQPSVYGALDVIADVGGVTVHRLVASLRFRPAEPHYRVRAGSPVGGALPVRNLGNTSEPITGRVESGPRTVTLDPVRILPGRVVRIPLKAPGHGSTTVTLVQAGRTVLRRVI